MTLYVFIVVEVAVSAQTSLKMSIIRGLSSWGVVLVLLESFFAFLGDGGQKVADGMDG